MRTRNAVYNLIASLIRQVIMILFNLVIPLLIIRTYGSNANGAVSSITKFLSYIAIAEGGLGGVVKAAFVKAIAKDDKKKINEIFNAITKFFRIIALVYVAYVIVLCLFYPHIISGQMETQAAVLLILAIAITNLAKYVFSLSSELLITANQKSYLIYVVRISILVVSGAVMAILINNGVSLVLVEFSYAITNALGAFAIYMIQKKSFSVAKVNSSIKCIDQRWSGLGIQFAAFLHDNIDIILITIFCALSEVSVYSVYLLVALGLRSILMSFLSATTSGFGDLLARNEKDLAKLNFKRFNTLFIMISSIVFATAIVLMIPFVRVYTNGIVDAEYIRPVFAMIYLGAEMIYMYRVAYTQLPFANGRYKEVSPGAYIETGMNLVISLSLISALGIIGVGIGTIVSMTFRLVYQVWYLKKHLIKLSYQYSYRNLLVNFLTVVAIALVNYYLIDIQAASYGWWALWGIVTIVAVSLIFALVNMVFNKHDFTESLKYMRKKILKKSK